MSIPNLYHILVKDGQVGSLILESQIEEVGTPIVLINGGPGGTFLDANHPLAPLSHDRDLIFYDQLGTYHSPAPFSESLTRMDRYVDELETVLDFYELEKAIILGHSFGGTLATDFALAHPKRCAGVIFSSPLLSTPRWLKDAKSLLSELPEGPRRVIERQLTKGDVPEEEFEAAEKVFYNRHVCRLDPWPARMIESFSKSNKEIYHAMWGISEFTCTGTLKNYDCFPKLHHLCMPCLFTCGRHDEARPETIAEAASLVKGADFRIFEESSHLPMWEQPQTYIETMLDFAREVDEAA